MPYAEVPDVNPLQPLPWHADAFRQLLALHASERLGHAWLFAGHPGTGKLTLATAFAQALFCSAANEGFACGACQDCHLFAIGAHPDFKLVQPEKKLITVDQIRETIEFAQNTSRRGGMKIMVFEPAEAMNMNAANALLKLLEEPPQRTLLMLVSHQPGLLLATIRSRCQALRCSLPPRALAVGWLQAQGVSGSDAEAALQRAGGAPLRALAQNDAATLAERRQLLDCLQGLAGGWLQPVEAAKKCEKSNIAATIDYQLGCVAEFSACAQGARALQDDELLPLAGQLLLEQQPETFIRLLHRLYGELQEARRVATASNNANQTLLLEALFGRWVQLGQRSRTQAAA